jgi:tetratricopeptide (TPR) repeat protein
LQLDYFLFLQEQIKDIIIIVGVRVKRNLGTSCHLQADFRKAIEHHTQCLSIANEVRDRAGEGKACGNPRLGNAHRSLSDVCKAIKYHTQCLAITKEVWGRTGEGKAFGNLGIVYEQLYDFSKAIKYHTQCLAIAKEGPGSARPTQTSGTRII